MMIHATDNTLFISNTTSVMQPPTPNSTSTTNSITDPPTITQTQEPEEINEILRSTYRQRSMSVLPPFLRGDGADLCRSILALVKADGRAENLDHGRKNNVSIRKFQFFLHLVGSFVGLRSPIP